MSAMTLEVATAAPALRASGAAEPAGALLARLAAGDRHALGPLYDLHGAELYGAALWRTGSEADAADVVQAVFARLAELGAALERVRRPRAYLFAMVHRAAIDVARRRQRRRQAFARAGDAGAAVLAPAAATSLEVRLDAARASRLVLRLPAAQREAVYLRYFADLTFAEIGRVQRVSTFTAAGRHRLGIARLRRWLEAGS